MARIGDLPVIPLVSRLLRVDHVFLKLILRSFSNLKRSLFASEISEDFIQTVTG